jgi:GTP pyrophosphokinase
MQAENFKRILLTLNDDVRVVLIKLADRLHNCRTIEYVSEHKRKKILSETMYVFIPLAHRLGLYGMKSEMEDIWLRYNEPEAYNSISEKVNKDVIDKEKEIDEFIAPIEEALRNAGFRFEIKKRVKTPYSIWHKMNTKGVSFEEIFDLYAVRIIFDPQEDAKESERDQCYHIFSIITSLYKYKSDRIRDWVNFPKNNGYEALHCTLMSRSGIWVEVQIRSRRMHEVAEKGIAAHWSYKKDGFIDKSQNEVDKWIVQVKEILVNPDVNALDLLDMIHNDLIKSEIFVFTPKGEQRSIEKGATALDFAYSIHSQIGHKAIAAKVNLKLVPLSRELKTGDQVEIITAETEKPKREWLDFVKTRKAKALILDYLKDEHKEKRSQFRDTSRIRLNFKGLDRIGILHDITRYISTITDVHIKTIHLGTEDGVCEGYIEVKANKAGDVETIINEMSKVEGIQAISRAEI